MMMRRRRRRSQTIAKAKSSRACRQRGGSVPEQALLLLGAAAGEQRRDADGVPGVEPAVPAVLHGGRGEQVGAVVGGRRGVAAAGAAAAPAVPPRRGVPDAADVAGNRLTLAAVNAVVVITAGVAVVALDSGSDRPAGVTRGQYALGLALDVLGSALHGLIFALSKRVFARVVLPPGGRGGRRSSLSSASCWVHCASARSGATGQPSAGGHGSSSSSRAWKIAAGVVGAAVALGLFLALALCLVKHERHKKMEKMERDAEVGETFRMAQVGWTQAPVAPGTRTQPVIERDYVP